MIAHLRQSVFYDCRGGKFLYYIGDIFLFETIN